MNDIVNVSLRRREFLALNGVAAGALVLAFSLPGTLRAVARLNKSATAVALNAFVEIDPTGQVTVLSPYSELGQGIYSSLCMLVAEELDVEMDAMRIRPAPAEPQYMLTFGGAMRLTAASLSMRDSFDPLRRAGATARAMLLQAAADAWGSPFAELGTEPGHVVHAATGRRIGYGELATAAAALEPPAEVAMKDPADYRLLGRTVKRLDIEPKTNGQALFASDLRHDTMLIAAVRQAPQFGAEARVIDASQALRMRGVAAVEEIPSGIAVLADNYWRASQALDAVEVEFGPAPGPVSSSAAYREKLLARARGAGIVAEQSGDVEGAFAQAAKTLEATYDVPFLAHATMEPQTCAALVEEQRCTVWAPTQLPDGVVTTAAEITGLPAESIDVKIPYVGAGLGRRSMTDFVAHAVTLANRHRGRFIKVIWSREEDMQHDYYRPMAAARFHAALDGEGRPLAIRALVAGDGPERRHAPEPDIEIDESVMEGALHQPYEVDRRIDYAFEYAPAPIGWWRAVGHSYNAFFVESFIDEMAHAAGADPVDFRRQLLNKHPRFVTVLDRTAEMAAWRKEPWQAEDGRRHAMGIALHGSLESICCAIVDVSIDDAGKAQVHRAWCVADCGFAVNPLAVETQIEGGFAMGLSAALVEEITIADGRTKNGNFGDYPILTAPQMPAMEVALIDSGEKLGGVGELSTPLAAPAVCNALFTLTGQRIRSLPLRKHRLNSPRTA
jgi:isoquinoline 1-oxidoreductase beta subunit